MSELSVQKSCHVCKEQSHQCLSCASYVVDGERIYYERLKDFGATKDHEVRFIKRIQKQCVTGFFHSGKLYIPSRQGRSVPLAIGLQWGAWQEQQEKISELMAQLDNMEACYIQLKQEHNELIAFNTVLDRKQKAAEKTADKYKFKVSMIAGLLRDSTDQDMTLKAIQAVIDRVGAHV